MERYAASAILYECGLGSHILPGAYGLKAVRVVSVREGKGSVAIGTAEVVST